MSESYGPPPAARERSHLAFALAYQAGEGEGTCVDAAVDATYDLALGLNRSVCLSALVPLLTYRDNGYEHCHLCRGWAHMDEPIRHDEDCLLHAR